MKTKLFMLICFMLSVTTIAAQECFTPTYNRGKELYNNGQYKKALAAFKAAVNCPDKPADNDLESWIIKAEQKLRTSVIQPNENRIYKQSEVDKLPLFPGGKNELDVFVKEEMQYPEAAKTNGQEETVAVTVTIAKTGKIENPKISGSLYSTLANEALRIVKRMPDWIPAEKNGKKVAVEYVIPIEFKIGKEEAPVISEQPNENRIYKQSEVDKLPMFPGGKNVLDIFVKEEMQYPEAAKTNGQEGTVAVTVIIGKTGRLENPKISGSRYSTLANEALRIVKRMPDWIPAEKNGKKVAVEYVIPIEFKLGKEEAPVISEITPEDNALNKEKPKLIIPTVATAHETSHEKDETVAETAANNKPTPAASEKMKRHQFSLDLGIGVLIEGNDDYGNWTAFSTAITAQYQYNLSKFAGLNLSAKILSDFGETTAYGAFAGIQLTTPNIGKKLSLYVLPKIGFAAYENSDVSESGLTYEIGAGINLNKRFYVGYNYMGTTLDSYYLSSCTNHSFLVGVRF